MSGPQQPPTRPGGLFGGGGGSAAKLWKPLGPGAAPRSFAVPAPAPSLADAALSRLLPLARGANSFVRDILAGEAPERRRRGRQGRRVSRLDEAAQPSDSTLGDDGGLYDAVRSSFPHLLGDAQPPARRSRSVPRAATAPAGNHARYEADGAVSLTDETRSKIRKHTTALSNVCRILTDLLELRDQVANESEDLEYRKDDLLDEMDALEEGSGPTDKKIHLQWELEKVQRDLDHCARLLNDIDDRLAEIGEETQRFEKRVRSIKAGPISGREDGSSLAEEEDDFSVRVITLEGHTDSVECLDFDEPWKTLVTGSADTTVRVWDLSSQHQWALLRGHTGGVNSLHLLAQQLLTASADNTVRLWDLAKLPSIPVHYRSSEPFFTSDEGDPDNESICATVLEGHSASVNCVQGDGEVVVSGSSDCTIRTWDLYDGRCTAILHPGQDDEGRAARDGASWGWGASPVSGERSRRKGRRKGPRQRGFVSRKDSDVVPGFEAAEEQGRPPGLGTPSSSKLRFGGVSFFDDDSEDGESEADLFQGFARKEAPPPEDGMRSSSQGNEGRLKGLGITDNPFADDRAPAPLDDGLADGAARLTISTDSASLLHSYRQPPKAPPPPTVPVDTYGHVAALQFWKHALASGHGDGVVRLWDLRQNECTRELRGHLGPVTSLQFDEHSIVTASSDNTIRVWDLRKGDATDEIRVEDPVNDLRFDEGKIYLAGGVPQIRVYNRLSGKIKLMSGHSSPQAHKAPTRCVRYGGRMLASGSMDATAKVWTI
ncbi:WD40-repeat-containing domain protein [Hyaloraphidium curvatum]|nr:WD40-repeat-containing domain protein [Hyaloraphidium curvatum]